MILIPDQLIWNYDMTGCQKGQKTRFHWISIGHRNLSTNHTPGCTITEGRINIENSKFRIHSPISKFCGHSPKTTPLVSGFHLWYNLWALVWRKKTPPRTDFSSNDFGWCNSISTHWLLRGLKDPPKSSIDLTSLAAQQSSWFYHLSFYICVYGET